MLPECDVQLGRMLQHVFLFHNPKTEKKQTRSFYNGNNTLHLTANLSLVL